MKIANYVYIIECQGKLKIGKSQNPEQRLKELNTGNPNKLRLIHCEKFASQKASSEAEAMMHYYFEAEKIRGEWFKSNKKEAIEILNLLSQKRMGLVVGKKQIKDSLKKKQKRVLGDNLTSF